MGPSTNATGRLPSSKGLLRPEDFADQVRFDEATPSGPAAQWVERIWSTRWEMPAGETATTSLIPHPSISLTVERGGVARDGSHGNGVWLTGVVTGRFDVARSGHGGAVGIKFRPGGFTAWSGVPADRLTDRVVPAGAVIDGADALSDLALDAAASAGQLCDFIEERGEHAAEIPGALERVLHLVVDSDVIRVDELARRCGCSVRSLQRLTRHYVGVGPKWLIRRQRMHDAVAALDAGSTETLAELAVRLGWYDQSQFARDFAALVGSSPAAYRDR